MNRTHFLPVSRHSVLRRERVIKGALRGDSALVVLSGRPGTGKTVAATQIAKELAAHGEEVVWVRLSADDGQYVLFWRRLLEALIEAGVTPDQSLAQQLLSGELQLSDSEALSRALSECRRPLALVIDDLHHLMSDDLEAAAASILRVIEGVARLRLIAMTRRPFPQLTGVAARVRIPVIELSEEELAFTPSDIERLISTRMPEIGEERLRTSRNTFSTPTAEPTPRRLPLSARLCEATFSKRVVSLRGVHVSSRRPGGTRVPRGRCIASRPPSRRSNAAMT